MKMNAREIDVQFAISTDQEAIASMVEEGELVLRWDAPAALDQWLVAKWDGDVVGCAALFLGVPFGRLEYLSFLDGLTLMEKREVGFALLNWGLIALRTEGTEEAIVTISIGDKGMKRLLKKHYGATTIDTVNVMTIPVGGRDANPG